MKSVVIGPVLVCLFLLLPDLNYAQQTQPDSFIESVGLQFGAIRGQTSLKDGFPDLVMRFHSRHPLGTRLFDDRWFGEAALSLGVVSGVRYRTRLLPVEYRINYRFTDTDSGSRAAWASFFPESSSPYLFAGAGLLYYKPVEIPAPDDPFTGGMGGTLPASSLWGFRSGLNPFIPVGAGMDFQLDRATRLNLQFGYNHSLDFLSLRGEGFRHGFWGLTVGLAFAPGMEAGRHIRGAESVHPLFSPPVYPPNPVPPANVDRNLYASAGIEQSLLEDAVLEGINRAVIRFKVMSAEVESSHDGIIGDIAAALHRYEDRTLMILGHADSVGADPVNEMISESRARAMWLELIDRGIEPGRIEFTAYSDRRPKSNAETYRETRYRDRRVEFRVGPEGAVSGSQAGTKPEEEEIYVASVFSDFEYGEPLLDAHQISFNNSFLDLDETSGMFLLLVSYLLHSEPGLNLLILSEAGSGPGPEFHKALSRARADVIRQELILRGVEPERLMIVGRTDPAFSDFESRFGGESQTNLLIPLEMNSDLWRQHGSE